MRDLASWKATPWPQLEPVHTAEQYAHVLRSFGTGRIIGDREPGTGPFLDELRRRGVVTFDEEQPYSWLFMADLRLSPELDDLWPLPESVTLSLNRTPPFGGPDSEPEDNRTEEDLDRMVSVLGPLMLTVSWNCGWRGLSEFKGCGVTLCLNGVWSDQAAESSPGEFGVWISLGSALARKPEGEAWLRDSGLVVD